MSTRDLGLEDNPGVTVQRGGGLYNECVRTAVETLFITQAASYPRWYNIG